MHDMPKHPFLVLHEHRGYLLFAVVWAALGSLRDIITSTAICFDSLPSLCRRPRAVVSIACDGVFNLGLAGGVKGENMAEFCPTAHLSNTQNPSSAHTERTALQQASTGRTAFLTHDLVSLCLRIMNGSEGITPPQHTGGGRSRGGFRRWRPGIALLAEAVLF